jgi:CheY-like chemotaxis protein
MVPSRPFISGISRILLAEDNLVNQRVALMMLGKMGHRITLATNGLETLEQSRQSDFDLILMDVLCDSGKAEIHRLVE